MPTAQFLTCLYRCVILTLLLQCATQADAGRRPTTTSPRPHVLVILVDDLGYGDLSSYGAQDLRTPHIDQLVKSGMRFSHFYANCPVCSPTRAALLSGRYPELVGVPGVVRTYPHNNWGHLSKDATLLPSMLKPAGYHTAMVGKWHLGLASPNLPNERGFDFFHGFLGDMMDDYFDHRRHGINYMRQDGVEIDPPGHATDLFTEWTCSYLRSRRDKQQPFFLYLAYNAPHTPIQPPPAWLQKVKQRNPRLAARRSRLVALIEHLDDGIGQVMRTLRETGLDRDTLVIFTSDNGGQSNVGASNGALRAGKQDMYEGGLRVPTGIVWPGQIPPDSGCDQMAISMDLFPTICEAAGVHIPHPIDGQSLLPILQRKQERLADRDLFFHRREGGQRYSGLTTQAMRRGPWKLVQNSPFAPLELYNLTQDPLEKTNLARQESRIFRELSSALRIQIQRGGAVPWQRPDRRDTP
ncbi:MAG: N-acetylgalactosamine 6-sulfate sulfatase [Planctomycetaceae bacterium]|nr:N-acetylgalactosamine 6-sulfate sulfatase [Planctomycetaceae bacterium]